jgi:hypothetical protein
MVDVQTFAGWQWSDTDPATSWDYVPPPFHAEVIPKTEVWYDKPVRTLQGIVREPSHPMNGFSVLLSARHDPWDGDVNVTLKSDAGRQLRGFGKIDLASFDG